MRSRILLIRSMYDLRNMGGGRISSFWRGSKVNKNGVILIDV